MGGKIIRELIGMRKDETGLDRCPWCNEDVPLAVSSYEGEWAAVAYCDDCDTSMVAEGESKEGAIENLKVKWNTRYERTCHDLHDELTRSFECSECGCVVGDQPLPRESFAYCPGCGAKVVD